MALTFLRHHLKRNALKLPAAGGDPSPQPAPHQPPCPPPPPSSLRQEPTMADDASLTSETVSDGGGQPAENTRSPFEEQDSGISADSGSNFSRQGSSDSSMDKDLKPDELDATPNSEGSRNRAEVEIHRNMEGLISDYTTNEDNSYSAIIDSSRVDFSQEIGGGDCLEGEEDNTGTLTSRRSGDESKDFSTVSDEGPSSHLISEMSTVVNEEMPSIARLSQDDDLDEPETNCPSSEDFEVESPGTSLSEIESPSVPPPPPLPGLDLRGDHTTSSTTDSDNTLPKSGQKRTANGMDLVDRRTQTAAQQMSGSRKISNSTDVFSVPTSRRISETINDDIKAVIVARQKRAEQSGIDYELRLPQGKATFYQARIGVVPEDTELGRLFRKRAEKLGQPGVEPEVRLDAQQPVNRTDEEEPRTFTMASTADSFQKEGSRSEESIENPGHPQNSIDEREETEFSSDDETIRESSVHEEEGEEDRKTSSEISENSSTYHRPTVIGNSLEEHSFPSTTHDFPREDTDQSYPETNFEANEDDFDAVAENLDRLLLENDNSSNRMSSTKTEQSTSSPELSPSSSGFFEMADTGSSPSTVTSPDFSPTSFISEDVVFDEIDDDVIANSAQTVQEHSKLLSHPLKSYNILPPIAETEHAQNAELKSNFSFRHVMQSLRSTLGRRTKKVPQPEQITTSTETGKMEFDDNWSIHDTIKDKEKPAHRSLQDVFGNHVVSFSEFIDPNQNSGKDFSVRNWREVLEQSDSVNLPHHDTEDLTSIPAEMVQTKGHSGSNPNLGILDSDPLIADAVDVDVISNGHISGKFKKSKSKSEIMDAIRSNRSSTGSQRSRLASPGLNSTLPSRRSHGMMQSLDSIFPASQLITGQQHYQKRSEAEPTKYLLSAKSSNALLSPVVRRQQRSKNGKK